MLKSKYSKYSQNGISSRLPEEAELLREQFKINYKIGYGPQMVDAPYSEAWYGPRVPAGAKTARVDVVWVYPPTGERVPLLSKTMFPQQEAPELDCINAEAGFASDSTLKALEKKESISRSKERLQMLDSSGVQEIFLTRGLSSSAISTTSPPKTPQTSPLLGTVGIRRSSRTEHSDRNFLRNTLQNPPELGTLTFAELSEIPTKEYHTNAAGKQELTQTSIEWTDAKNLLEYAQNQGFQGSSEYDHCSPNHVSSLRRQDSQEPLFLQRRIAWELWGK